ncbi:MAG TPA: ester cyclase [Candidatus Acidoferrum sp.]|nr:ester cyclase [Candidatus Acidoferrum sp.]
MKIRFGIIVAIVLVGMSLSAQEKSKPVGAEFMRQAFAAWSLHDPDKVVGFYTEDVVYEDVAYGVVNHGRPELRKFAAGFFEAVPDLKLEVVSASVYRGHGAVEWILSGTDKGLYKTGKKFSVRGASVFEMRGGKCSANKDFYDLATIMRQLGVLPEKPA